MNSSFKKIYDFIIFLEVTLIPNYILVRTNPDFLGIKEFMIFASKKIKSHDRILDAGAGTSPYKKYYSHAKYESTDFEDIFDKSAENSHTFICSIDDIPKPKNHYEAIINTQVLEHVEYPQKVINEFFRVLKPGGKLFLTAPQGWGLHGEPYNFYNFTYYGLESLFKNAGFKTISIKPRGGFFWYLGSLIRTFPSYIYYQYLFERKKSQLTFKPNIIFLIIFFPLFLILKLLCSFILPFLFYYLDPLDKDKIFTLGYNCYCIKK